MKKSLPDPYWPVVGEQHDNLLRLYQQFAAERPVMLFDIQEQRGYAYPYRDFAADLSKKSQRSLARQYQDARDNNRMVVFIRDSVERRLRSYSVPLAWSTATRRQKDSPRRPGRAARCPRGGSEIRDRKSRSPIPATPPKIAPR